MAQFSEWSPYEKFVQAGLGDGQFLNGGFTILAAGPPRLSLLGGPQALAGAVASGAGANQIVMPIGVVQNVNLSHNRTFNRIFEVGSERSFFISGRTIGQLSLARILYHGPSLLRMLYAYYEDVIPPTTVDAVFPNVGMDAINNPHDVIIPPGYENLFINLASDLFNQPVGLMLYIRDNFMKTYGSVYMEGCYVPNHTWATDSQGVLIQESAAIQFERVVPVAVSDLTLVTGEQGSSVGIGS